MNALLEFLDRGLTKAERFDRPPDFHGSKMNYTRRRLALDSWHNSRQTMFRLRSKGVTQEQVDRAHFGHWYDFAVGIKREETHAARVAKAQAALQYRKESK